MGILRHRRRHLRRHRLSTLTAFTFLLFASTSAICLSQLGSGVREKERREATESASATLGRVLLTRRRLGGPGSSPPSCRSKCGKCLPCWAVHVPIQPGLNMPLEYYPEAWRCKCGNKLFMP